VAVVVVVVRMMMVEVVVQADDKIRPCRRGNLSPFRVLVLGLKERSTLVLSHTEDYERERVQIQLFHETKVVYKEGEISNMIDVPMTEYDYI